MYGLEIGEEYGYGYEDLVDEMLGEGIDPAFLLGDEFLVGAARPRPTMRRRLTRPGVQRGAIARRPTMPMRRPQVSPMQAALAQRRAQQEVLVKEAVPTKGRALFMGLDSGANIAAGATATVTDRPQKLFRPERLAVPASIAPLFVLNSLNIGTVNQFVSNTAVPCETFQEGGVGVGLKGDTARPGIDLSANVTNISGGAARFRATVFGSSVE